ncbi:MAG: ABC transporter substrate-binding protein [Spirochaetota bacterium]|nr:ABC transporter substrate-binding protein [Spirochaetota bacterium]
MSHTVKRHIRLWLQLVQIGLLALFTGCILDGESARKKMASVPIAKPAIKAEIDYMRQLKDRVEKWEEANQPRVFRDGFNQRVTDKNRNATPVKGGSIRVRIDVEPKVLSPYLDNSYVTKQFILTNVYDSLLTMNPETFKLEPSLAESWEVEDVVWLKGKKKDSPFEKTGQKNFIIGKVDESSIQWSSDNKTIRSLAVRVNGRNMTIPGDRLRKKINPRDRYTRYYDRAVVFTFTLRRDVKWHDGRPFTANDVLFTLNTIMNPYIVELSHFRNYYQNLKRWEKLGEDKIRLYFDTQYFKAIENASGFDVLPRHVFIKKGKSYSQKEFAKHFVAHPAQSRPVGTGPYYLPSGLIKNRPQMKAWHRGSKIILMRNDDYFNKKRQGYLKELQFIYIKESETAFIELKNSSIDFHSRLSTEQFFTSSSSRTFKDLYTKCFYYTGGYGYIGFNIKRTHFKDRRVRVAFSHLLNRKKILDDLLNGLGKVVSGSQFYFGPAYNHSVKPYPYNPDRAITLLEQAGWVDTDGDGVRDKDGVPFEVELLYPGKSHIPPILHEELAKVGIKLKLTILEWNVFLKNIQERRFDLCMLGWATPIESDPYQVWHSSQWANGGSNHIGFENKESDRIIEEARRTVTDKARWKLYHRQHEILHREQPYLFLFTSPNRAVYRDRYRNVRFYRGSPGFDLREWYIPTELQTPAERKAEEK